jgi:hypothetical protein
MIELLAPAAFYAETHFRFFRGMPSALFRREPEIAFDLPRRLIGGVGLPIALLINDVHKYRILPESAQVTVSRVGGKPILFDFDEQALESALVDHPLKRQMLAYVLTIPRAKLGGDGEIFVNACLRYRRINKHGQAGKRVDTALNDNLAMSTKLPFRCVVGDDKFPGEGLCAFGDLHCHSAFSRSHVEFGPPIEVIDRIAAAGGLGFVAVTDHSYDLACDPCDYLRQDKGLRLWGMYRDSVANSYRGITAMIPSEEISVLNGKNKVVHICALGTSEYIPGTLDGARKNVYVSTQLTIQEAVDEIERQGGVSFAAHAGSRAGLLQGIFLRRGDWRENDLCGGLGGVQAVNSDFGGSWIHGKNLWVLTLLKGRKTSILAGSDAHGDFNRYRAVAVPFLRIYEDAERYMGFVRTGVYGKRVDAKGIIDGIRNAETFITGGPFLSICDGRNPDVSLISAKKAIAETTNLCVKAFSTKEFGPLNSVTVMMGCPGGAEEKAIVKQALPNDTYDATIPIPANMLHTGKYYLRAEVYGKTPRGFITTAATGACFIGY